MTSMLKDLTGGRGRPLWRRRPLLLGEAASDREPQERPAGLRRNQVGAKTGRQDGEVITLRCCARPAGEIGERQRVSLLHGFIGSQGLGA